MANSAQPHSPASDHPPGLNWEGEEMCVPTSLLPRMLIIRRFNVYIFDYCTKRGYNKTARTLQEEAGLSAESRRPPIDAKQGLLYE